MSSQPSYSLDAELTAQLAARQCSSQWRGFLAALGQEFVSALPPQDLEALMSRVGARFAVQHPLGHCPTLEALEGGMNAVWRGMDWGLVMLQQQVDHLSITHQLSPLTSAFGPAHTAWSGGFLRGVYQTWFAQAGAGSLALVVDAPIDAWGSVHLRLAR